MVTGRKEGTVLIVLLTVSTIVMMTVMGVCCIVGNKHYKLYSNQAKRGAMMMEDVVREAEYDAAMNAFAA